MNYLNQTQVDSYIMGIENFTTPIFNGSKYIDEGAWGLSQYATDISGGYYGVQWVLLTYILIFGFTTKLYGFKRGSLVSFFISSIKNRCTTIRMNIA